jgi:aminomethyltransferase
MALRTPLYDWHVAHNGRMVDFAGWDMPVQYTTIVEEHAAVRTGAGLFDISHMGRLSFGGPDSLALIQSVTTNNAATLKDNQVRYALVCNEAGGILDDVLVYRWSYGYAMVVNASNRLRIVDWIAAHKAGQNVEVWDQTTTTAMIAVQGPKALELCRGLTEADVDSLGYYYAAATRCLGRQCVVSRTGYTGEDGLELMVPADHGSTVWEELLKRGAVACGLGARDTLRLEAGMPLYGHELDEQTDPLQAGLAWAVKFDKREFVGREAMLRRRDDAALPKRIGLELAGRRIARDGAAVVRDGETVGRVTSGTFAPTLQKAIAMAYVKPTLTALGGHLQVDVRGKLEDAKVVPVPFYRRQPR